MTTSPYGRFVCRSAGETKALGERLAKSLKGGEIVLAYAPMGAGKTCFAQGLAKGLGVTRVVNSPTFNMIKVYSGKELAFYHVDAYRLEDRSENRQIGLSELLDDPAGVTYVEWPEHVVDLVQASDFITVTIRMRRGGEREVSIAHGRKK